MRLLKAELLTSPRSLRCARCQELIPKGDEHWREVWADDDEPTVAERYHVKCDCEDETQEELRNQLIEHLEDD